MKHQADKKRRDVELNEEDSVYLKLKPYRFKSLAKKPNEKLAPRYYGPDKVIEKLGKVALRLELPPTARIHNVFHISQLKQALKPSIQVQPIPRGLTEEMELQVYHEAVTRGHKDRQGKVQILVKWKDLPGFESTWEEPEVILSQFPTFHLEDVFLAEGGNDWLDKMWGKVYKRKKDVGRRGPAQVAQESKGQNGQHGENMILSDTVRNGGCKKGGRRDSGHEQSVTGEESA